MKLSDARVGMRVIPIGETAMASAYTVLSIDRDAGWLRLRTPTGEIISRSPRSFKPVPPPPERCPDCGERGERKGHQTCQYPQD